jgi:hypothetical protein
VEYDRKATVDSVQIWNSKRIFVCEFLGFRSSAVEVSTLLGRTLCHWMIGAIYFETKGGGVIFTGRNFGE